MSGRLPLLRCAGGAAVLVVAASTTALIAAAPVGAAAHRSASSPTCSTVSLSKVDSTLGITAAYVGMLHPIGSHDTVICSYFSLNGNAEDDTTVEFLPSTAALFSLLRSGIKRTRAVSSVTHLDDGAFYFKVKATTYLYALDGRDELEIFADAPSARLESLARRFPLY